MARLNGVATKTVDLVGLFITNAGLLALASKGRKRRHRRRRPQACPANARRQPHGRAAKLEGFARQHQAASQRLRKASRTW